MLNWILLKSDGLFRKLLSIQFCLGLFVHIFFKKLIICVFISVCGGLCEVILSNTFDKVLLCLSRKV